MFLLKLADIFFHIAELQVHVSSLSLTVIQVLAHLGLLRVIVYHDDSQSKKELLTPVIAVT